MLFGIGSDSEIKNAVIKSINSGNASESYLDFENKINKEYFIKEIFHSLDWDDLYDKRDWWDVFGWDRAGRMERVEAIVNQVMTEKKIEIVDNLPEGVNKVDELKSKFPFFKKQELAALANSSDALRLAGASDWDSTVQRIGKEKPPGCTDTKAWAEVMELSDEKIDHFKTLIRKGVDPKYLSHLLKGERQTLIHIGNLYRDLEEKREFLPDRLQKLFRACDKSNLILFALERKVKAHRPFFEKALSGPLLIELNGKASGEIEKSDTFANDQVLKEVYERKSDFFKNRSITIKPRLQNNRNFTFWITNINSLITMLNRIPAQPNESFSRTALAALLQEALDAVAGSRRGAVDWQISELTKDPRSGLSFSKSKETWVSEIHDLGEGKVRVDHISQAKIQDGKKIEVGSCNTRFSYSIALCGDKYYLSKLEIGKTTFEWNAVNDSPFTPLKGGDLLEVFKRV